MAKAVSKKVAKAKKASKKKKKAYKPCQQMILDLENFEAPDNGVYNVKTVMTSWNAVTRRGDSEADMALHQQVVRSSNSSGALCHAVTIALNAKAEQDPAEAFFYDRNMVSQVFKQMIGGTYQADAERLQDDFIDGYIRDHPFPEQYKRDFILRTSDVFTKQYEVSVTAHVVKSFTSRIQDHLMCYMERLAWSRHCDEHFAYVIKTGAKLLQRAGAVQDDATAAAMVEAFLVRPRGSDGQQQLHEDWRAAMGSGLTYIRNRLQPFRVAPPEGFRGGQVEDGADEDEDRVDEMGTFFKNIYRDKPRVLHTEAAFRSEDEQYRVAKELLWTSINSDQPYLAKVMTKAEAQKQLPAFRTIEPPAWVMENGDGDLTEEQKVQWCGLQRRISDIRTALLDARRTPGTMFPPKRFTLLPVVELHPMMLPLDDRIVTSIVGLALDKIQPVVHVPKLKDFLSAERGTRAEWRALQQEGVHSCQVRKDWKTRLTGDMTERGWWLCMLNLHDKVRVRVPRGAERSGEARMKPLGRKLKLAWGGIRCLWGQQWTIEEDLSEHADRGPPWFVNNITTDGLQVNVTLATKRVETVIPGVAELIEKGYTSIKDVYKADTHTRGLFGSAAKISDQLISALNAKDRRCFIEATGVDAGQILLYTAAAARISSDTSPEDFKKIQPAFRSASDHKFLSLSKAWRKFEGERRRDNTGYSDAISQLSGVSMRTPGGAAAYTNTLHSHFITMAEEKLSWERRRKSFDANRAKMRDISRMAVQIAGRSAEAAALRKFGPEPEEREALLTRMRDNLAGDRRTWTRVVFFGNAQFGTVAEVLCLVRRSYGPSRS
ncbi:hypothetical protein JKP88DRAFT_315624 [Tribonema minus]|uniref:Uncharacterized protein n=1 Tax=Tribonema minus TaxID=303371 RepID=A0A836CFJ9_9STRA|nr:hypothetical protein JKP88DRAFT_315624 [Tribonema minus]